MGLVFKDSPKIENGTLNLTFWDFEKNGEIYMDGEWEIYWKKIYRPNTVKPFSPETLSGFHMFPGSWKGRLFNNEIATAYGYATFRLKVLLPDDSYSKKQKLALRMKEQSTAYELYIDDELVAQRGQVGVSPKESTPGYGANTVFFETEKKSLNIILIVSNFHHRNGGIWSVPILGNHDQIQYLKYERNSIEFLLGGSILIMTIYHFMLFLFRKNDLTSLYFALFCLTTLMRVVSTGEIMLAQFFPNINYEIVTKFEYFSFYLFAPLFLRFYKELFPNDVSNRIIKLSTIIGSIMGMIVLFSNLKIYNHFVDFNYIVILITIVVVYYYNIKVVIKRRDDSILIFLFTNVLIIFILNDIFYNIKFIRTSEFIQIGVFIFLLAQSVILSRRFSLAFRDIERLSNNISKVNNAYSNFVPKEFLRILNRENITDVALGDLVKKDITILFSGIRDFILLSEKVSSEEIFDLLNKYYTGVTSIIRNNNGFIDKFIGDEIIVIFPESPEHAVKTSKEIIQYLETFNQTQAQNGKLTIKIGMGIHSGNVTLGTLGGKERMETTVIGNAVGFTKKLESLTKVFYTPVILSSDTYSQLDNKSKEKCREIDHLKFGNNPGFFTIYEYFGGDPSTIQEQKTAISNEYFRALALYRGGFIQKAKDLFVHCQKLLHEDPISSIYINRCNDFLIGNNSQDGLQEIKTNTSKPLLALIADEDPSFLNEMEILLKKEKLDTILANSGKEVISFCEKMKPSLIFVSLDLPDMSGIQLINLLRKVFTLSKEDCYIIAMSADNTTKTNSIIYESGADDFIIKPIQLESIKEIINRAHD